MAKQKYKRIQNPLHNPTKYPRKAVISTLFHMHSMLISESHKKL